MTGRPFSPHAMVESGPDPKPLTFQEALKQKRIVMIKDIGESMGCAFAFSDEEAKAAFGREVVRLYEEAVASL